MKKIKSWGISDGSQIRKFKFKSCSKFTEQSSRCWC